MSQVSIDVRVNRFTRRADGTFEPAELRGFQTVIDDAQSYELPMVVTKKDQKGNTLEYIACKVTPSAPVVVSEKQSRKARSVVVKPPKPESNPVPAPVEKPKRAKAQTKPDPKPAVAKGSFDALLAALGE